MSGHYPDRIKQLSQYDGRFDAYQLTAQQPDGRGCKVLFASYPAGTEIEAHQHDSDNYGIITRGELILIMNNKTTRVSVGEWYHVPANTEHAARFEQDTDEIEFWFES
jgi:quercetin dioxygenase-like cupin family protein